MKLTLKEATNYLISLHPENFLSLAKTSGYICPVCGSGSGRKGTGMKATYENGHTRFLCYKCRISGDIIDYYAYTQYGIPFEAEQSERFKYGIIAACEAYGIECTELKKDNISYTPKQKPVFRKIVVKTQQPELKNYWPTVDDIDNFLAKRTPSNFTDQACRDWVKYRGLDLWAGADKVLKQNLVGLIPRVSSKYDALGKALEEEKKGQKIIDSYLVIKQQNIHGNTVGYKLLLLPFNSDGTINDITHDIGNGKLNTRSRQDGNSGVGYTLFNPAYKTDFVKNLQITVIVESIANAIALSQLWIQTVCIDSCANEFIINDLKGYFPNLALWLDYDAREKQKKYAQKYNLENIEWIPEHCVDSNGDIIPNFDQNDLVRSQQFRDNVDKIISKYYLSQTSVFNIESVKNVSDAYCDENGVCNIIIANTGNGKTYTAEQKINEYNLLQERCLYATDTQENVVTVGNKTNSRIIISTTDEENESYNEDTTIDDKSKNSVVLTHARLMTYGDTGRVFEGIPDKCNYPHKIIDEPQNLMQRIQIPFIAAYYESPFQGGDEFVWVKQSTFTFLAYYSDEKQAEKYGKRNFKEKTSRTKQRHEDPDNIFTLTKTYDFIKCKYTTKELQDPKKYTHLYGNVFAIDLEEAINWNEIPKQRDAEDECSITNIEYVKKMFQYLVNPRIICEFPIYLKTNEPLTIEQIRGMYNEEYEKRIEKYRKQNNLDENYYIKEEIKKKFQTQALNVMKQRIKSPKNPAYCPFLSGISILPWILLMRNKQTTLNLLSATFTKFNQKIIHRVAQHMGWSFRVTNVEENNFIFDVSTLQLKEPITLDSQRRLAVELSNILEKEKIFLVTYKKKNADLIFNQMKIMGDNIINRFCVYKHDFERIGEIASTYVQNRPESEILHIITYCNSSLVQGVNLNEHSFVILDVGSFISTAMLQLPCQCDSEMKDIIMTELLKNELIQTIGRVFRAKEEEIKQYKRNGETLKSEKKITIILHNMKSLTGAFSVDERLTYKRITFVENEKKYFISKQNEDDHSFQTLLQACLSTYNRVEPANQKIEDEKSKGEIKNKETLKKEREDRKIEKTINIIKELKMGNTSWRDISRKIHFSRFTPEEKEKIKEEYERNN